MDHLFILYLYKYWHHHHQNNLSLILNYFVFSSTPHLFREELLMITSMTSVVTAICFRLHMSHNLNYLS